MRLNEMTERTGWQGHSVRAAIKGLRKQGHVIGKRVSATAQSVSSLPSQWHER